MVQESVKRSFWQSQTPLHSRALQSPSIECCWLWEWRSTLCSLWIIWNRLTHWLILYWLYVLVWNTLPLPRSVRLECWRDISSRALEQVWTLLFWRWQLWAMSEFFSMFCRHCCSNHKRYMLYITGPCIYKCIHKCAGKYGLNYIRTESTRYCVLITSFGKT